MTPSFPSKLFEILDTPDFQPYICWVNDTDFEIVDREAAAEVLKQYFKRGNVCSFVRQLSNYNFSKVSTDSESLVFRHSAGEFTRLDREGSITINRRTSVKRGADEADERPVKKQQIDSLRRELQQSKEQIRSLQEQVQELLHAVAELKVDRFRDELDEAEGEEGEDGEARLAFSPQQESSCSPLQCSPLDTFTNESQCGVFAGDDAHCEEMYHFDPNFREEINFLG